MNITWYGQSCFRIEAKEGSVLTDPYAKEIGLRPPRLKDDIVLVSHEHHDHNATGGAPAESFIIRGPGEYERKGISVQGIASFHDNQQGAERGLNTIYVIRAEDVVLCHLGDFGQDALDDEQLQKIGNIDVLFIPVGGTYTIDAKRAAHVIAQIEPKVVIPMHYKIPNLKIPKLEGVDVFIKEIGLDAEKGDKFKVSGKTLPVDETQLYVFKS